MLKGLLEKMFPQETPETLFDYRTMSCVNERMMSEYVLAGRLKEGGSFLVACTKDKTGDNISIDLPLEKLAYLARRKRKGMQGLFLDDMPEYPDFLLGTQWFSRVDPGERITVVGSDTMTHIDLRTKNPYAIISPLPETFNPFCADSFQLDKISSKKLLTSDITARQLEEMVRTQYAGRIKEYSR